MKELVHGVTAYANGSCRCNAVCRPAWARYCRLRRRKLHGRVRRSRVLRTVPRRSRFTRQEPFGLRLSALGQQILVAAEARAGRPIDDIVEEIVRQVGPTIAA